MGVPRCEWTRIFPWFVHKCIRRSTYTCRCICIHEPATRSRVQQRRVNAAGMYLPMRMNQLLRNVFMHHLREIMWSFFSLDFLLLNTLPKRLLGFVRQAPLTLLHIYIGTATMELSLKIVGEVALA